MDIEQLRKDLKNYYGTAMFGGSPMAMMEISKVERASEQELIKIAEKNQIDIGRYIR